MALVTADLNEEFADLGGIALLADLILTVNIHLGNGPEAEMSTSRSGQSSVATLQLVAPSRIPSGETSITGEPKDASYVHKTLVHELSMLFLWHATVHKPSGWTFFGSDGWFRDGWEEYLSLIRSGGKWRDLTLPRYRSLVATGTGYEPKDADYVEGAVVLDWLHTRFGRAAMFALLLRPEPTFRAAFQAQFGITAQSLLDELRVRFSRAL